MKTFELYECLVMDELRTKHEFSEQSAFRLITANPIVNNWLDLISPEQTALELAKPDTKVRPFRINGQEGTVWPTMQLELS